MQTSEPGFIAGNELVWLKADGSEVTVIAKVGTPYQPDGQEYRCPVEIVGFDGRYPDIAGDSSLQVLSLAIRLLATRLGDLLQEGGRLVYPDDRSTERNSDSLNNLFGRSLGARGKWRCARSNDRFCGARLSVSRLRLRCREARGQAGRWRRAPRVHQIDNPTSPSSTDVFSRGRCPLYRSVHVWRTTSRVPSAFEHPRSNRRVDVLP